MTKRVGFIEAQKARLGERHIMNNGAWAKVIAYRRCDDIDIEFEDGVIVEHKQYKHFIAGKVRHPNIKRKDFAEKVKINASLRVGEKRKMKCGLIAEIIEYRNSQSIDCLFENGDIVKNKPYGDFIRGSIHSGDKNKRTLQVQRKGETNKMRNGMMATIIEYRGAADIDIRFEDGMVVQHRGYDHFKRGEIRYPTNSRLGETRTMHSGIKATIIGYRNSQDIDVRFEDGAIIKSSYYHFERGLIRHPSMKAGEKAKSRLGETRKMNCELKATIINYRDATNIDVQFEDGAIVKDKPYRSFAPGQIAHPTIKFNKAFEKNVALIGEKRTMSNGQVAELIAYRGVYDIDVRFEDGTIIQNKTLNNFRRGGIANPNATDARILTAEKKHIDEIRKMNNGLMAKIIAWRGNADVDVKFEDGTEVEHRSYDEYLKRTIAHPTYTPFSSRPERIINGYLTAAKIPFMAQWTCPQLNGNRLRFDFAIVNSENIPLAFIEYNGIQHYRAIEYWKGEKGFLAQKRRDEIKRLYAKNLHLPVIDVPYWERDIVGYLNDQIPQVTEIAFLLKNRVDEKDICVVDVISQRLGECRRMKCGEDATIIAYRGAGDIDIRFSDGTVAYGKSYSSFRRGNIACPTIKERKKALIEHRLGESKIMNCGEMATIIEYRRSGDIDVQFPDGTIRYHRTYAAFEKGIISRIGRDANKVLRIGESKLMNCEEMATIIKYRRSDDIDVRFPDGTVVCGKTYAAFVKGNIAKVGKNKNLDPSKEK